MDSGCSHHYLLLAAPCRNRRETRNPVRVTIPNGKTIESTHEGELRIEALPEAARHVHILPGLANHSLVSVGQLCDTGCQVLFRIDKVLVYNKEKEIIMVGRRVPSNGLWMVDLTDIETEDGFKDESILDLACNMVGEERPQITIKGMATATVAEQMAYLHACMFSPAPSTMIKAADLGFLSSFPGLTSENIRKHLPKSIATTMGHLQQQRQNTRSTRPKEKKPKEETSESKPKEAEATSIDEDEEWSETGTENIHNVYANVIDVRKEGTIYTDPTGRFPTTSSRGMNYILIVYVYNCNAILARPMKNRSSKETIKVYKEIYRYLELRGMKPRLHKLDNEVSEALKEFIIGEARCKMQLAPPHIHRQNAAERAIRTFKDHFIAGLASTDPDCPISLWCRFLPQAETTLNLMRASRINPKLSAHEQLEGSFDFNATPLVPPGTMVIMHEKPGQRKTFGKHGVKGWNIDRAKDHYRCHKAYIPATRGERIGDTVEFFPKAVRMPGVNSADAATHAARDLIAALNNPAPASPFSICDKKVAALKKLAEIFNTVTGRNATRSKAATAPRTSPRVARNATPTHKPTAAPRTSPRVENRAPPRVARSTMPTAPPRVRATVRHNSARTSTSNDAQRPRVEAEADRYPLRNRGFACAVLETEKEESYLMQPAPAVMEMSMAMAVTDPDTGAQMEYRDLIKHPKMRDTWIHSCANEFGRLAQGIKGRVDSTSTIFFIKKAEVPAGRTATYARVVVDVRPQKIDEPNRVRITVGGNLLKYPGVVKTETSSLTTSKIHWNSTISTPGAKYMCADVKNFYLNTPMARYEYMRMHISLIPDEIIEEYKLLEKVDDKGFVYMEIRRSMYGLKQAGKLSNDLLVQRLAKHGYHPSKITDGYWKHDTRPISFTLVVDDFGVKYVGKEHADHLMESLKKYYPVAEDWTGGLYCGITLEWNYKEGYVDTSMPEYVAAALKRFDHKKPTRAQHHPCPYSVPTYGKQSQEIEPEEESPLLPESGKTEIQQVVGVFLYYSRAVDPSMLVALGRLASRQSKATEKVAEDMHMFLDFAATNPDAKLRYKRSKMILHGHSDASYLNEPHARSRSAAHFFMSGDPTDDKVMHNGGVLTVSGILKHVMSSAAEAETGALFVTCKEGTLCRNTLQDMGHPQPATPITTDNTTAAGIANRTVKQKKTRAMDMRFYWLADRVEQRQFDIGWEPGEGNQADYFTKSHSPKHNQKMRPMYLVGEGQPKYLPRFKSSSLRGCADNTALAAVISLARRKISLARQRVLRTATANKQTERFRRAC